MREQVYSLQSAADSSLAERTGFIRHPYLPLGAIAAFALLEVLIFKSGLDNAITSTLLGSQYPIDRTRSLHGSQLRGQIRSFSDIRRAQTSVSDFLWSRRP